MPIEISCTSCSKRLRVPDNAAGKRVKCPQCQTVLSVPAAGTAAATSSSSSGGKWHMKTEDGQTFGPVPKKELDEWLAEGRITAECQLLKDGADQWQWASDVYPQLAGEEAGAGASSGGGGFPQIDTGSSGASDNPFAFAAKDSGSVSTRKGGGGRRTTSVSTASKATASSGGAEVSGDVSDKSKMVAGLLQILLPSFGIGRFYLGYTGIGVAQLLTCGGCGWWSLIDGIMIFMGKIPDVDGRPLKD